MKFPIPREYKYIRPIDKVWYGQDDYKKALLVPEISVKYGSLASKMKSMPSYSRYMIGALRELSTCVKSIQKNPYSGKTMITDQGLEDLLDYTKSLGISNIGFTKVTKEQMFSDSIVLFKNAIVFTMEMKKSEIDLAPSKETIQEIFRTYYELGRSVNLVANYLRSKGYNAQGIPAIGSNINLTLMARDAGLGEFGKHGLLITPQHGPSVRLAAILTDIENLPVGPQEELAWIKEFCETCNACVRKCPAGAIYNHPKPLSDGSEEHIDYKKCAVPFTKQYGCTICIKECSLYKGDYQKIMKTFTEKRIE